MSELVKLDPGAILQAEWVEKRDEIMAEIQSVESVETEAELTVSGKLQTKASKHLKELDKHRKAVKKPITDWVKENIDDKAKELGNDLAAGIARVKAMNGACATRIAEEAEAERQRIANEEAERVAREAEAERQAAPTTFGGMTVPTEPVEQPVIKPTEPIPTGKVKTGANAMVKVWEFQIVNAKLVPAEFLKVDESKVREYMNYKAKMGETPELAGVSFTSRVDVRSR